MAAMDALTGDPLVGFNFELDVAGKAKGYFTEVSGISSENEVTEHKIVGKGDIAAQTEQVLRNVSAALAAAGAGLEHVIKWDIHVVDGQPLEPGFEVFQRVWGDRGEPPVITGVFVAGLAHPDFLVEIDAVAVVPI